MQQQKTIQRKQQSSDEWHEEAEIPTLDMSQPPAPPDIDAFRRRTGEIIAYAAASRHANRNHK
jgi:hypothetical protein